MAAAGRNFEGPVEEETGSRDPPLLQTLRRCGNPGDGKSEHMGTWGGRGFPGDFT